MKKFIHSIAPLIGTLGIAFGFHATARAQVPEPIRPVQEGSAPVTEAETAAPSDEPQAQEISGDFGTTAEIDLDKNKNEVFKRKIPREELTNVPGTRGDALRAIELMPGVARPPFTAGVLIIRGSAPNDSEFFLDGVSVPLLYHFGGLTSFINSRLLESIEFVPGNFSAKYGRRIGGIVETETRDPAFDRFHGVVDASLIDASILMEGPLGKKKKVSIAAAVRRSVIDAAFNALAPSDIGVVAAPVYYDYQLFLTWKPTSKDKIKFRSYGSNDRFEVLFEDAESDNPEFNGDAGLLARFHFLHTSWERQISEKVTQEINVMAGPVRLDFELGDSVGFNAELWQVHSRAEWRMALRPRLELRTGTDVFMIPGSIRFEGPRPRQSEGSGNPQEPLSSQQKVFVDERITIVRPGLYVEFDTHLGERLEWIIGLRADYFSEVNGWAVDPRMNWIVKLTDRYRLKFGAGLYSQAPEFQESNETVGNDNLEPIHALHLGVGFDGQVTDLFSLGVDTFYKYLWNRVVSTPNGVEPFFNNDGIGRIYGAELSARLKPAQKNYYGYLSYTLSRSERKDHSSDPWRLFDFDQTHILTAAFVYRFKRNWELGGTYRLVSGNPFTPVIGSVYDAFNDVYIPINGRINSERSALFHRLDVRVEKTWVFAHGGKFSLYLDIQNAYNQQNQEGILYNYDFSDSTKLKGLPIIPALGIRGEI